MCSDRNGIAVHIDWSWSSDSKVREGLWNRGILHKAELNVRYESNSKLSKSRDRMFNS